MYSTYSEPQYHNRFSNFEPQANPQANPWEQKTDTSGDYVDKEFSPIEKSLRINFIRKVFSITALQILVTGIFVHMMTSYSLFYKIMYFIPGSVMLSGFVALITSLALGFSSSISRKVPLNHILLSIFTLTESYCLGYVAGQLDREAVLLSMYLTAAVVGALAIYAMKTNTEITYYGGLIVLLTLGTGALSFINWFTRFGFFDSLLFFGGCILAGLYFIYDIKLLIGKDRFSLTLDDYIRGSMHLYIDIVRIFSNILQIMAERAEEKKKEEERKRRQW